MNTAWTNDDILINLEAEVLEVKEFYNVPSLNHVPDCEIVPLRLARLGDLVHVGKGHVGIVFDVSENRGVAEFSIVLDNFRVLMKRIGNRASGVERSSFHV
jgi:hypothetical protein